MNDPSYFWRRRYNQKVRELAALQAELSELETRSRMSSETTVSKPRKREADESPWWSIDNMAEYEDDDIRRVKSIVVLLNTGSQLERDLCLEAGRILLGHLKLWKCDDETAKLAMPTLIKTCDGFLRTNYYAAARSFFASLIEWFYEQFSHAMKTSIVVYCHDCISHLVLTDYQMRYLASVEICNLLTRKRIEVSQPAFLNREVKKQHLLSAYYYFTSILQIANNTPPVNRRRYLSEAKKLQHCRTEMEKAFLETEDKFARIADQLCLVKWKLL
ncbi:hypothetical protein TRICI_002265 [Trichomonascus ciferrii]|uniref:Uncharacterized protein n=1 Tax=Trichomonascus ciferrii TaxID=44093 RepID=A0A642V739_9ASCO|nr:hypothetical protein TRICI_002265 [Trichomonascus ciferrii]